jgi:lipopolysaccharide/colanic/teichoic acid biosynthesis glycosyltransferase
MPEQQPFACYLQEVDAMLVGLKCKQREEIKLELLTHLQDAAAEQDMSSDDEVLQREVIAAFGSSLDLGMALHRAHMEGRVTMRRIVDICLALFWLCVVAPFCLMAAVLIKLDSPGPVFFKMPAVGQYGRRFVLYKFRTMRCGYDHPRLTHVGMWLRRATIDELPLLLNVLKGDISIFGPRVLRPYDLDMTDSLCCRILLVPPGACSPSVVFYGFPRPTLKDQLEVDMRYVERRSFSYDLRLMVGTLKQALLKWVKGRKSNGL